jgi:uncharacterized protein (DUF2164 family)
MDSHVRLYEKLSPYLKQQENINVKNPGNQTGCKELLAQGVADYIVYGEEKAIKIYDEQFISFIKNKVLA